MNWKKGFRRIAFVFAIFIAFICAGLSVVLVLAVRDDAQSCLRWEKENYIETYCYGITPEQAQAELERRKRIKELKDELQKPIETLPNGFVLDETISKLREAGFSDKEIQDYAENQIAKVETAELLAMRAKLNQVKQEKQEAEAEIKKLENGFWVNLSKGGLVGLCGISALVGGIVGFVIIWLIYKLFEWLVLGFCDNNRLRPEKT